MTFISLLRVSKNLEENKCRIYFATYVSPNAHSSRESQILVFTFYPKKVNIALRGIILVLPSLGTFAPSQSLGSVPSGREFDSIREKRVPYARIPVYAFMPVYPV